MEHKNQDSIKSAELQAHRKIAVFKDSQLNNLNHELRTRELAIKCSQLSRKRPVFVHEKVVAYDRWSLEGTIKEISPNLYSSTNNNCYVKLLPLVVKIRQIDKAVSIKTNSFWVLQHGLCKKWLLSFIYPRQVIIAIC